MSQDQIDLLIKMFEGLEHSIEENSRRTQKISENMVTKDRFNGHEEEEMGKYGEIKDELRKINENGITKAHVKIFAWGSGILIPIIFTLIGVIFVMFTNSLSGLEESQKEIKEKQDKIMRTLSQYEIIVE